jgi:hypothetical protein
MRSLFSDRSVLLVALLCAAGCSLMYADDADKKQCTSNDDCKGRVEGATLVCTEQGVCADPAGPQTCEQAKDCPGGQLCGFDGLCYEKWGCLDNDDDWPVAASSFTYSAQLVSLANSENPALLGNDIEVIACSAGDPDCTSPISTGKLDAAKDLTLTFSNFKDTQFNGFIRVRDSSVELGSADATFLPAYIHYGRETRLVSDLPVQSRIFLVSPATYMGLAKLAGVTADAEAGTVIFIMQDCGGHSASKVSMKPMGTNSYTFVAVQGGNQPVPGATSTTEDGAGLLLNIPRDQARTFVLRDDESGRVIDNVSINVRGHATNYVFYYPRYSALKKWLDESKKQGAD